MHPKGRVESEMLKLRKKQFEMKWCKNSCNMEHVITCSKRKKKSAKQKSFFTEKI